MSNRRTMGAVLLEETLNRSIADSPLRRRSLAATPLAANIQREIIQNDDESERLARRRQLNPLNNSRSAENTERRVSLALTAGLSANEVVAHYNKCLQLCAENKINLKNAFALSMIDYMSLLNNRDKNSNNMQTAGSSLDVSTKIYGLRVDCVYLDAYKMIGEPGSEDKNKDGENAEENNRADQTNPEEIEVRKKKKRPVQDIRVSDESLDENIERFNLMGKKNHGDTQTTDLLNLITFPIHATSGYRLHLHEDLIFDLPEDNNHSDNENLNEEVEFDETEEAGDSIICTSFNNFNIVGWSEADIPDSPPKTNGHSEEEMRFDLDASVLSNAFAHEINNSGMDYFDPGNDVEENVDRCGRRFGDENAENIVNFCGTIAYEDKDRDNNNVDYSYAQNTMKQFHWAGPVHWRPKTVSKVIGGSRLVGACRQEGIRKKREINLEQNEELSEDFLYKLESIIPKKLQSRTVRQSWQEDKLCLPEDIHYDSDNSLKLYFHTMRMRALINERKRNEENTDKADDVLDEACENYNYDNLNDTVDYCSQNDDAVENGIYGDENGVEGIENGDNINDDNGNNFDDLLTQGFTGENLVALPKSTAQIQIAYSTRAKKIDMRQLKKSIWKALTVDNGRGDDENNRDSEITRISEERDFTAIYKGLPILLGKDNSEALSPALAFASLLHLANEKNLDIFMTPDLSDLNIRQG